MACDICSHLKVWVWGYGAGSAYRCERKGLSASGQFINDSHGGNCKATMQYIGVFFLLSLSLPYIFAASLGKRYNNTYIKDNKQLWKDCSKPDDSKRLKSPKINIDPNPPKKGEKINISFELDLLEEVTSGEMKVNLKYGNIPIVDETLDLCDLVTQINKECPLKKGDFSFKFDEQIPDYIPSGGYEAKAVLSDQNGAEMFCLEVDINL